MKLPCGCCEDGTGLTPIPISNRQGQTSLQYRVGTHAAFLESMIERLSSSSYPELAGLKTRDTGDFSIALLDAWATVADVLTFYQERIANEGYLRTATERRSVLELARLVGYTPRPGVASSVYLAYEIEKSYKEKVDIPAGERVQSLPAPGELPQSFETSEPLSARAEWNAIRPRMTRPMDIRSEDVKPEDGKAPKIYLKGTATNLKPNDKVLFVFKDGSKKLLTAYEVNVQPPYNRTEVIFEEAKDTSSSTSMTKDLEFKKSAISVQLSSTIKDVLKQLAIPLKKAPNLQPLGNQFLNRNVNKILKDNNSDFVTQTLGSLNPRISNILFPALSSVDLVGKSQLEGIYVLRLKTALFGYNALFPKGPEAQFSFEVDTNNYKVLHFTDQSKGDPTSWYWQFGNDGTSTEKDPTHEFKNDGTYIVSLSVENAGGTSTAKWTIEVYFHVN